MFCFVKYVLLWL